MECGRILQQDINPKPKANKIFWGEKVCFLDLGLKEGSEGSVSLTIFCSAPNEIFRVK